jgi:hypothetical protein
VVEREEFMMEMEILVVQILVVGAAEMEIIIISAELEALA